MKRKKQGITAKQKPVTGNVGFDVLCLAWLKEVRVEVRNPPMRIITIKYTITLFHRWGSSKQK